MKASNSGDASSTMISRKNLPPDTLGCPTLIASTLSHPDVPVNAGDIAAPSSLPTSPLAKNSMLAVCQAVSAAGLDSVICCSPPGSGSASITKLPPLRYSAASPGPHSTAHGAMTPDACCVTTKYIRMRRPLDNDIAVLVRMSSASFGTVYGRLFGPPLATYRGCKLAVACVQ